MNSLNCLQGQLFINGFNVGRYWPTVGPQVTLYIPAGILRASPQQNHVVVLELEKCPACTEPPSSGKHYVDNETVLVKNYKDRTGLKFDTRDQGLRVQMWNSAVTFEADTQGLELNVINFVDRPVISSRCFRSLLTL